MLRPPRTPHGKTYVIARRTASDRGQIFPTPKNPSLPRGGLGGGLSWLSLVAGWCMLTRVTAGGTPLHGVGGRSAQTHTHDATIESCRGGSGHTPSNGEGAVARTDPVGLHWGGRRRGASVFPRPLVRIAPSCVSVRLVGTRCFPRESGGAGNCWVPPLESQTLDRAGDPSLCGWITCRIVSRFSVCMVASTPRRLVRGAR